MSTVADTGFPTLIDVVKRQRPDGSVEMQMANTLTKKLALLQDMPQIEGNLQTGHRVTAVNALPPVTWRKLNQGVKPGKGQTAQYDESCGLMECWSKVDAELVRLASNGPAFRASEDGLATEAMTEEAERSFFYESTVTNPERIHGLTARYAATTGYQASAYVQKSGTVATAAGCRSIWVVTWDPDRLFGIYPKGTVGGLEHKDYGERPVSDASGNDFSAWVSKMNWRPGLCVKDFRYAVRLQWDPADATQTDSAKLLYLALSKALNTVREVNGRTRIYWDRISREKVAAQLLSNSNDALKSVNENGPIVERYMGVQARLTDALIGEDPIS